MHEAADEAPQPHHSARGYLAGPNQRDPTREFTGRLRSTPYDVVKLEKPGRWQIGVENSHQPRGVPYDIPPNGPSGWSDPPSIVGYGLPRTKLIRGGDGVSANEVNRGALRPLSLRLDVDSRRRQI